MLRRLISGFIFFLLFALIGLVFSFGRQQSREIDLSTPYIHYYSFIHQGLIIERADGTDSRIISGVAGEDANRIVMHGWSASGQWFVISGYWSNGEPARFRNQFYAVNVSNGHKIDLGVAPLEDLQVLWSPTEDILLINHFDYSDDLFHYQLLDVETNHTLASVKFVPMRNETIYQKTLNWADDGAFAYVSWDGNAVKLYPNGQSLIRMSDEWETMPRNSVIESGRYLYPHHLSTSDGVTLRIVDLFGDDEQYIEIADPVTENRLRTPYAMRWNPTGEYALVSARECYESACEPWLKLVNWSTGEVTDLGETVTLRNDTGYRCDASAQCSELWSPNGRFALLYQYQESLYVLDVETKQIHMLSQPNWNVRWLSDNTLVIPNTYQDTIRYNPYTQEEIPFDGVPTVIGLESSPDGTMLTVATNPPSVVDMDGNLITSSMMHSHSFFSTDYPLNYFWSEDSQWVMANYTISFAGGGSGPAAPVLFNLDGTVRRELPTGSAANFIPSRVVQHVSCGQETSIHHDPLLTIPHDGRTIHVGWHPTDTNQIVTYSVADSLTFWSIENGQATIISQQEIERGELRFEELPLHPPLAWLPSENTVLYVNSNYTPVAFDLGTGIAHQTIMIDYPTMFYSDGIGRLQYALSEEQIPLEYNLFDQMPNLAFPTLASNLSGLIFTSEHPDTGVFYIEVDGTVHAFDSNYNGYGADANQHIVALGDLYRCCVTLFDTQSGEQIGQIQTTAVSLALSPDGTRLLTSSDGLVSVWDLSRYHE